MYFSFAGKVPKGHPRGHPLENPIFCFLTRRGVGFPPQQPIWAVVCLCAPPNRVFANLKEHLSRHSIAKAEMIKYSPQERVSGAKDSRFADLVPQIKSARTIGGPRRGGKAETEEVSADFWLLLFRDKSNPLRRAEHPKTKNFEA